MQRAQSAVDVSTLLNPEPSLPASLDAPVVAQGQASAPAAAAAGGADSMTAAALLRPNGPLPAGQATGDAVNELPRPYKCPLCEKAFHRLEHQTRHIRTHTGEKPHACAFPGCSKKFSRSDELTRHSRIHNNPNSRRGNKAQQSFVPSLMPEFRPPPSAAKVIRSAPSTVVSSPNHSPPHLSPYNFSSPAGLAPFPQARGAPGNQTGHDMALLTRAARQVERDSLPQPLYPTSRPSPFYMGSAQRTQLPGLQAYHMSRSHSNEDDDHYNTANSYRQAKRSRPNSPRPSPSPFSTAPSSPTYSHGSLSPTPEATPLATPAHSPRLPPLSTELAPFRNLAIAPQHFVPALAPLEPSPEWSFPTSQPQQQQPSAPSDGGISLSDILSRPVGTQRKLPVPKPPRVAIHDLLAPSDGSNNSGRSSSSNSVTGADISERA